MQGQGDGKGKGERPAGGWDYVFPAPPSLPCPPPRNPRAEQDATPMPQRRRPKLSATSFNIEAQEPSSAGKVRHGCCLGPPQPARSTSSAHSQGGQEALSLTATFALSFQKQPRDTF